MESALGWLGEAARALGRVFPRLTVIRSTHRAVAFVRGKHPRAVGPGIYFWWPILTELEVYAVVRQSLNLPPQVVTTKDDVPVAVSGVIIYEIEDVLQVATTQWNHDDNTRDISMAAIRDFVCEKDYAAIRDNRHWVEQKLFKSVSEQLTEYGVKVCKAWLTDFARTRPVSLIHMRDALRSANSQWVNE